MNLHRAGVGAYLLKIDPEAERIAQGWAETMATTGDYHHNPGLAADMGDPHRRNMEGPAFTHLGVGRALGGGGKTYWVEVFVDRLA